jgi:hypothetical protein
VTLGSADVAVQTVDKTVERLRYAERFDSTENQTCIRHTRLNEAAQLISEMPVELFGVEAIAAAAEMTNQIRSLNELIRSHSGAIVTGRSDVSTPSGIEMWKSRNEALQTISVVVRYVYEQHDQLVRTLTGRASTTSTAH